MRKALILAISGVVSSCSSEGRAPAQPSTRQPEPPPASAPAPESALSRDASPPASKPPPDPEVVARAEALLERGMRAYRKGEYDVAQETLKEAITIYPFLPKANVALGKILLIRGSASRDMAMIDSARLMFEMAHALDPDLHEAAVLLELFQSKQE